MATNKNEKDEKVDNANEVEKEETKEETKEEAKNENNEDENEEEQTPKDKFAFLKKIKFLQIDENLSEEEKKQAKLKIIIIGIGGLIVFTILIGVVLFFLGVFDPPEEIAPKQTTNKKKISTRESVKITSRTRQKQIKFSISQINTKRLNKKLKLLTKYEILEEDAIEKLKAIEKEKAYKRQQQERLDRFARNNKEEALTSDEVSDDKLLFKKVKNRDKNEDDAEEFLFKQVKNKTKKKKEIKQVAKNQRQDDKKTIKKQDSKVVKTVVTNQKAFVKIPITKLAKFKSFISKAKLLKVNLSICKNNIKKTQIFLGPFKTAKMRDKLIKTLNKKQKTYIKNIDITDEEFNKSCKI
jgi:ABC-type multidrug transport system fused ATPase/permease subunit